MSKKETKQKAQDELMLALQTAFYNEDLTDEEREEMSKQMERIEKMFGYTPGSWLRG